MQLFFETVKDDYYASIFESRKSITKTFFGICKKSHFAKNTVESISVVFENFNELLMCVNLSVRLFGGRGDKKKGPSPWKGPLLRLDNG